MREILMLLGLVVLGGCGSWTSAQPRDRQAAELPGMPPDFALSLGVHVADVEGLASEPMAAWYLVEADGRLRASPGARRAGTPLPPLRRQLTHEEVARLWSTIRAAGLAPDDRARQGESPAVVAGVSDVPAGPLERPTASLYVSAGGDRRGYQIDLSARDVVSGRVRALAGELARLSGLGAE